MVEGEGEGIEVREEGKIEGDGGGGEEYAARGIAGDVTIGRDSVFDGDEEDEEAEGDG